MKRKLEIVKDESIIYDKIMDQAAKKIVNSNNVNDDTSQHIVSSNSLQTLSGATTNSLRQSSRDNQVFGFRWKKFSCAFDSVMTILFHLFQFMDIEERALY
jgi:hypothetical protein